MDKKAYIIEVLETLKNDWVPAYGLVVLAKQGMLSNGILDVLVNMLQSAINEATDEITRNKLIEAQSIFVKIKEAEAKSMELDNQDIIVLGAEKAQKLEQVLDIDKGKEGLQLPKNFEDTFKNKENRALLVKAVNNRFENSDAIKQNKDAIIGACKTEINSWGETLPTDAGKVAVLYLYNALNGKTLYKEDVSTAFTDFKKAKTEVASIPTTGVEGKDAKAEVATKPAEVKTEVATTPVTKTTEAAKPVAQTPETKKPAVTEKATSTSALKDQVTSIPAFKDNGDIQKSLQKITETQTELSTTKEQLKTTKEDLGKKTEELTKKQQELGVVEKKIDTANSIPDAIAKESALNNLAIQKDKITGEVSVLENQVKPLQKTERRLVGQEKFLTKQLEHRNKDLAQLIEPTKNRYEESKNSITQTIDGLNKSINGNYTEEQKKLIDTE